MDDYNNHECDENCECCGCGEERLETVKLTLEDLSEVECEILGTFDESDREYIALLPIGKQDVLIYRYEEDGEEVNLNVIDDDDEFERVSAAFYSFCDEEEDGPEA